MAVQMKSNGKTSYESDCRAAIINALSNARGAKEQAIRALIPELEKMVNTVNAAVPTAGRQICERCETSGSLISVKTAEGETIRVHGRKSCLRQSDTFAL